MRVLALETSTKIGSVAVVFGERIEADRIGGVDARHGETLLPLVQGALREANVTLKEVGLLAVGCGPGSFTGTRVGLACAKGFVLGTGLPLVGVPSFAAIAGRVVAESEHDRVVVVSDAGRGAVFAGFYEFAAGRTRCIAPPFEVKPDELVNELRDHLNEPLVFVGSGVRSYPAVASGYDVMAVRYDIPRACDVARQAQRHFHSEGADDAAALEPIYVRASDAKLPEGR